MFLQRLPFARTATGLMMALAFTVAPAYAAKGGSGNHGGGGSYHGGGGSSYHGGGYNGGGYRGGYNGGGYRGGYGGYGGYGYGRGGYYGGYGYGSGIGLGIGIGAYPSYGYSSYSNYYNPDVQYAQPSYSVTPSVGYTDTLSTQSDDRAHINVQVSDPNAEVFFDGGQTRQKGNDRTFVTPPLSAGQTYHYTIEARWMENGKQMEKTRTITVNPGGSATVIF
jgi:uncharacterized protein (TIGR03000 family)